MGAVDTEALWRAQVSLMGVLAQLGYRSCSSASDSASDGRSGLAIWWCPPGHMVAQRARLWQAVGRAGWAGASMARTCSLFKAVGRALESR